VIPTVLAAVAALAGVFYGARLTNHRESTNWTRDQRLKIYVDLLKAVEECYGAFTLLCAVFSLRDYDFEKIKVDKLEVDKLLADWDHWYGQMEASGQRQSWYAATSSCR
jgi:hypothetical protein